VKDFLDDPQTTVEVVNCTDEPVQVKVFEPVSHAATRLFRSPLAEGTISPGTNRVYTVKASKDADTHLDVEIRIGNKKAKCEVVGDQVIFVDGLMRDSRAANALIYDDMAEAARQAALCRFDSWY